MESVIVHFADIHSAPFPTLVGLKLPAVVDVNQEVKWRTAMHEAPADNIVSLVRGQLKESGVVQLQDMPCNKSAPVSIFNYCGSYLAVGDNREAEELISLEDHEKHSYAVPLASLLTFTEGNRTRAHALIADGVDFASVETLTPASCEVVGSTELTMERDVANNLYTKVRLERFTSKLNLLSADMASITALESRKLGTLALSSEHRGSLARTLARAKNRLLEKHRSCTVRLEFVCAACKSINGMAVYWKKRTKSIRHLGVDEVILPNVGSPGEYFSVLIRCL